MRFVVLVSLILVAGPTRGEARGERGGAPTLITQVGHAFDVLAVAVSPDGRHLATGSGDTTIRLWEMSSGRVIHTIGTHTGSVRSVAFSRDGRLLLTGTNDRTARLFDVATGGEVRRFEGHEGPVLSAAISADGRHVLTGSDDGPARLWDAVTGREVRRFEGHKAWVHCVAFSHDGRSVVTGHNDGAIRLWETATGREVRAFRGHERGAQAVELSSDGRHLVSGGSDGSVRLWNAGTGEEIRRFEGPKSLVTSVAISSDGRRVLAGGWDRKAWVWDTETGRLEKTHAGHESWIMAVAFAPDGRHVVTGSRDRSARLWSMETGRTVRTFSGGGVRVLCARMSPDGRYIATGHHDGWVTLWDTRASRVARRVKMAPQRVFGIAFSPDGRRLVTCGDDRKARLIDVASGRLLRTFEHGAFLSAAAFSARGDRLLTGSWDRSARLWDVETGKEVQRFEGHDAWVVAVAISPDGKQVLTGAKDKTLRLWDVTSGDEVRRFEGHAGSVWAVAFAQDGRRILSGSADKTARLWDAQTGEELKRFEGHIHAVDDVSFGPEDRSILTASWDTTVRLWDPATGAETRRLEGHAQWVFTAQFTAGGRRVLTGSQDGTARIWDAASGAEVCSLTSFRGEGWACTTPAGRFDAGDIGTLPWLHWVMPEEPMRAYPVEAFTRDFYLPRLLARVLADETLPEIPDLRALNRALPTVRILDARPLEDDPGRARVVVEVREGTRGDPTRAGGARDLRLFRDGRLVAWREGPLSLVDGRVRFDMEAPLWALQSQREVEISAYAFNADGVKSETSRARVPLPPDRPVEPVTTYVIAVGISSFDDERWDLGYAAADALALKDTLGRLLPNAVPVSLRSTWAMYQGHKVRLTRQATKANLRNVLAILAGHEVPDAARKRLHLNRKVRAARPQDLVVLTISTHGVTRDGEFYLLPTDVTKRRDGDGWLASCISATELAEWLRPIDAEMVMIVDACQSAASVATEGFRPGPMGSSGLGQLAYDKQMRILAASQSTEVALESGKTRQGLLSYVLAHESIWPVARADFDPKDGKILLTEWLRYAVRRVPGLAREIQTGKVSAVDGRGVRQKRRSKRPAHISQTPALFDFVRGRMDFTMRGR